MSEYEPGTVAMVTIPGYDETLAFWDGMGHQWVSAKCGRISVLSGSIINVRRLVVLDPFDPPLLANNLRYIHGKYIGARAPGEELLLRLADQIEAQTRPPKPPEPQGLGAVVEDRDGLRWVNSHRVTAWVHQDMQPRKWGELDVVRVLSEGVTQ